ncbi:MAG: hypothetical protein WD960_00280 [Gemmatimonadota bacterium]
MRRLLTTTLAGSVLLALTACDAARDATGPTGASLLPDGSTLSLVGDGLQEYLDPGAFEAVAPGLTFEGFDNPVPGEGSAVECTGPLDATTDNECFAPGGLVEGLSINSADDRMIILTAPFLGLASNVVGPWGWGVALEVAFPEDGVSAAAVRLLAPEGGPTEVAVDLYGSDGASLGSGVVPVGELAGEFWGVVSDVAIGRMVFTPAAGVGLLLEEVRFSGAEQGPDTDVVVEVRQGAINPASRGVIPVAVYSSTDFDAADIDPATVRFGRGEAAPMDDRLRVADLDDDGLADLLLHFPTPDVGLRCGDVEATLSGETLGGGPFEAVAQVRVLCLRDSGRAAGPRGR